MNENHMQNFAVIFDMDGVIVDSNPTHKSAIKQFLDKHGKSMSDREMREKVYGRINRDWLQATFPGIGDEKIREYIQEKEQIFREMFAEKLVPLPGLPEFLEDLSNHDVPLAVASSAPEVNVDWVLENTGLQDYFKVILHEGYVHHGKPHPEMYLKSIKALNMEPSRCIIFEDSLSGVEAGKRAGGIVIGVTTTHSGDELGDTEYCIRDFSEIDYDILVQIYNNVTEKNR